MTSTSLPPHFDLLPRGRKLILTEFHKLRAQDPVRKKTAIIREIAKKYQYAIGKNGSSSHVATVIREWQADS